VPCRQDLGLRLCHTVLRVDAVPAEQITESLDLIAQGREGCPLLLASGFVTEQLLFPVPEHGRVLEVLGVDGAFLVAADLGDLLVELGQVRGRCLRVVPAPTSASPASRDGREAQTTACASPGQRSGRFQAPLGPAWPTPAESPADGPCSGQRQGCSVPVRLPRRGRSRPLASVSVSGDRLAGPPVHDLRSSGCIRTGPSPLRVNSALPPPQWDLNGGRCHGNHWGTHFWNGAGRVHLGRSYQ